MGGANIKSLQESSYPIPNWCATAIVFNAVRQFCFPKPNSARLGRYDTICSVVCQRHFCFGSGADIRAPMVHSHFVRTKVVRGFSKQWVLTLVRNQGAQVEP